MVGLNMCDWTSCSSETFTAKCSLRWITAPCHRKIRWHGDGALECDLRWWYSSAVCARHVMCLRHDALMPVRRLLTTLLSLLWCSSFSWWCPTTQDSINLILDLFSILSWIWWLRAILRAALDWACFYVAWSGNYVKWCSGGRFLVVLGGSETQIQANQQCFYVPQGL